MTGAHVGSRTDRISLFDPQNETSLPMSQLSARLDLPQASGATKHHIEHAGLTWLDLIYPSKEQMEALREFYHFHPLHTEDVLSRIQRPKIDDYEEQGYLFMVLHFPIFNESTRLSTVCEVDIFVGKDYIITSHDGRMRPLLHLLRTIEDEKVRERYMSRGPGYLLYHLVEMMLNTCFPMLYRLDEKLDLLEEEMFKNDVQKTVEEVSFLRRDLISLRRIIRPNIPVVRSLAARQRAFLQLDEEEYFGDLTDSLTKMWDMLEEQKEIIEGIDATLGSLTSHRINQEMKIFTMISVIMLPMTLIASILGMNVPIPFSESPLALPIAILIMGALALVMYIYFRFRQWV